MGGKVLILRMLGEVMDEVEFGTDSFGRELKSHRLTCVWTKVKAHTICR